MAQDDLRTWQKTMYDNVWKHFENTRKEGGGSAPSLNQPSSKYDEII